METCPTAWACHARTSRIGSVPGSVSGIGREPRLRAIEGLKFKQILSGGTRFRLTLERANDDANAIVNPRYLVEVTSPSTEEYDRGDKLSHIIDGGVRHGFNFQIPDKVLFNQPILRRL